MCVRWGGWRGRARGPKPPAEQHDCPSPPSPPHPPSQFPTPACPLSPKTPPTHPPTLYVLMRRLRRAVAGSSSRKRFSSQKNCCITASWRRSSLPDLTWPGCRCQEAGVGAWVGGQVGGEVFHCTALTISLSIKQAHTHTHSLPPQQNQCNPNGEPCFTAINLFECYPKIQSLPPQPHPTPHRPPTSCLCCLPSESVAMTSLGLLMPPTNCTRSPNPTK